MFLVLTFKAGNMPFRLCWPIPLFILTIFLDVMVDLTDLASFFVRHAKEIETDREGKHGKHGKRGKQGIIAMNRVSRSVYTLLYQDLAISEPWELVSVEAEGVLIKVKVI
jgi:hypothetical protein